MNFIRNFCIIAHIDHGKSTLADRLIEETKTISNREKKNQLLDNMDLEREKGITIKSHAIQMNYLYKKKNYTLNLIDTPGHSDFSYEVSKSISACEGALLVIDASQSIEAQTISNLYLALDNNLTIIPILNKIDLESINKEKVVDDIINLIGCDKNDIIFISAKKGIGINKVLTSIIDIIPPPNGDPLSPLQAIIFDSKYNPFHGIEIYFRVINGQIYKGQKIKFMSTNKIYYANEIGVLKLNKIPKKKIITGDVGYLITGIKNVLEVKVGDTITGSDISADIPIKKFKEVKPFVFAGIYPINNKEYEILSSSIQKLKLNDSSLTFTPESSNSLGFGFRCGFLGMLHMEITKERLKREYNISIIITVPNVSYKVFFKKNPSNILWINNPSDISDFSKIKKIEEPYIQASIITLSKYLGPIISFCITKRGLIKNQSYITEKRIELIFHIPLSEIVFNFYEKIKTISKGYASFDYIFLDYRISTLSKVDILINGNFIDSFSSLVHSSNSLYIGKKICKKLKELIPRQQFEIAIQAVIGNKIISRETIKPLRKDVISKCYGGDFSRKKKLLEKQKEGKKKMRQIGKVKIPQSAFMDILNIKY